MRVSSRSSSPLSTLSSSDARTAATFSSARSSSPETETVVSHASWVAAVRTVAIAASLSEPSRSTARRRLCSVSSTCLGVGVVEQAPSTATPSSGSCEETPPPGTSTCSLSTALSTSSPGTARDVLGCLLRCRSLSLFGCAATHDGEEPRLCEEELVTTTGTNGSVCSSMREAAQACSKSRVSKPSLVTKDGSAR